MIGNKLGVQWNEVNDVKFLTYEIFRKYHQEVTAIFSTRQGGVSSGIYATMSLGFGDGDCRGNVAENYKRLCGAASIDVNRLVRSCQEHEDHIRIVTSADVGKGIWSEQDYVSVDGMITQEKNVPLVTLHADCTPIYFFAPDKKVIGLAHSGWRGTALGLAGKMVDKMQGCFNASPELIKVVIGPTISGRCYEVGHEVIDAMAKLPIALESCYEPSYREAHYLLDLSKVNHLILHNHGIQNQNIFVSNICTKTNHQHFFSHRAHGNKRGTNAAMMVLR